MEFINDKEMYKEECQTCGPCILGCAFYFLRCFSDCYSCINCHD